MKKEAQENWISYGHYTAVCKLKCYSDILNKLATIAYSLCFKRQTL